jgi:hypothetical protein
MNINKHVRKFCKALFFVNNYKSYQSECLDLGHSIFREWKFVIYLILCNTFYRVLLINSNRGSPRFAPVQNNADFEPGGQKVKKSIFYYYL